MSTPFDRAMKMYSQKIRRDFQSDLRAYLLSTAGVVIKTENVFAMGHPVFIEDPAIEMFNWWDIDKQWEEPPNAWFIIFAIGSLMELARNFPKPLKYVCFHRKHMEWHVLPFEKLARS